MFYGIPKGREKDFKHALDTITEVYSGDVYYSDMLITVGRNLSFKHDQKFMSCFHKAVTNNQEMSLLWRTHTLAWAAKNALHIEGDFVECGVFKGFCMGLILNYLDFQNLPKKAYLYDTFEGLPEKTSTALERRNWNYTEHDSEAIYKSVQEKFSAFGNVNIVRGVVPDSFAEAVPEKIAFLHIDMNSMQAELLALEHLFNKVTLGGFIIFDDFGWMSNFNQMTAELAFMTERGHTVMELPTGQGLVIKHA